MNLYVQGEIKMSSYEKYLLIPYKSPEIAEKVLLLNNDSGVDVTFKRHRQARSLDANAYMWTLLGKLAEAVKTPKEEIYRELIKRVGVYQVIPIKDEAVERFVTIWNEKGVGWITETIPSKLNGYTNIVAYYGSSAYDTKEMSQLIDEVVYECKENDIETATPEEIRKLKEGWRNG